MKWMELNSSYWTLHTSHFGPEPLFSMKTGSTVPQCCRVKWGDGWACVMSEACRTYFTACFFVCFFSMNMYFRSKNLKSIENFHQHSLTGSVIKVNLTLFLQHKGSKNRKVVSSVFIHPSSNFVIWCVIIIRVFWGCGGKALMLFELRRHTWPFSSMGTDS